MAHDVDETLRLVLFAILMLFVACKMALSSKKNTAAVNALNIHRPSAIKTVTGGAAAGALSGFFGVSGGFIIVPLLTMIFAMPYRKAVSTSLAAIFLISTTAVTGAYLNGISLDWSLFVLFVMGGLVGMLAGTALMNFIPERTAKIIFAAIIATLAVYMLTDRLFLHQGGA